MRLVPSAEMAASAVCSKKGVEMIHECDHNQAKMTK